MTVHDVWLKIKDKTKVEIEDLSSVGYIAVRRARENNVPIGKVHQMENFKSGANRYEVNDYPDSFEYHIKDAFVEFMVNRQRKLAKKMNK